MRTFKIVVMTLVVILLVAILSFVSLFIYEDQFIKQEICRESSPDNAFVLILYQVGSPQWSFGSVEAKLVLENANGKKVDEVTFSLANDGAGVFEGNIEKITWLENQVEIIMGECDTTEQFTYVLSCTE